MKPWLRNVLLISTIVILWAALLLGVLSYQHRSIIKSERWVSHSYEVVTAGKSLEADINRLIAKQRGYLITNEPSFLEEYQSEKQDILSTLIEIAALTQDSQHQQDYVMALQSDFVALTDVLDARIALAKTLSRELTPLRNAEQVRTLNDQLQLTVSSLLQTEHRFLDERLKIESSKKKQYAFILYGGICASILLILGLNAAVFRMNYRREAAERENLEMQSRLAMAMNSTSDGVFDWDIENNSIYYSPRFKQMLGYRDDELENDVEIVSKRIHPDDIDGVWKYLNQYLKSQLSEYTQVYRIEHKNGGWVWIQSRGRAVFNRNGKAIRLIGAHTDVTPMKEMEEKLKREKVAAETSNHAKSEFLANMSHEIRTPLNSIIGVSNILAKSKKLGEDQTQKLIRTLQNSSVSLMDLINDILDFAKIESGELKIETRDFELVPLMEQVISIMSVKANEKGIGFRVHYDQLIFDTHHGDELRVRQILLNLVGNAIKFTDKGSVTVTAWHENNSLLVQVKDTGIGIETSVQEKLFQKFEQGDSSVNRKYGGTGLGLAISQQLAQMMNGTITLESTESIGSTFTLCLPVSDDVSACKTGTLKSNKTLAPYSDKILIAEDYEGNIIVIKFLLDNMGIQYDIANNGAEAIKMYRKNPYPLVLMDVQMPEVDGFEATREIRQFEKENGLKACVIIAMTAHALAGDSQRCINAGMNDYLSKPLMEADLRDKFAQHLQKTVDA
jgi:PAS domain S-box-containing protein